MKILFINREDLSGTGASTYAGQLIGALGERHDVSVLQNEADAAKEYDVVHALNLKHLDPSLAMRIHSPLIVDVHDAHWARGEPFYPVPDIAVRKLMGIIRRRKYAPILSRAKAIIVHSNYVARRMGSPKTRVVQYAVEKIEPGPPLGERPPHVIFAGRDYFRKGLPVLLKAWRSVRLAHPGARLFIAGREFIHGRVYARIFSNDKSITLLGGIPREDLIYRIRNARALVLPSYTESFGIVLLEAMAAGTPAMGSAAGGIPEALREGRGGILVEPGNSLGFAKAIEKCLDDDADLEQMINRGKNIATEHTIDTMAAAVLNVYEEALRS